MRDRQNAMTAGDPAEGGMRACGVLHSCYDYFSSSSFSEGDSDSDDKKELPSNSTFRGRAIPPETIALLKKRVDVFKPMTDNVGKENAQGHGSSLQQRVPLPLKIQNKMTIYLCNTMRKILGSL